LRRTGLYVSLLGISGALYLSVFEQPARNIFLSILMARILKKAFPDEHKLMKKGRH